MNKPYPVINAAFRQALRTSVAEARGKDPLDIYEAVARSAVRLATIADNIYAAAKFDRPMQPNIDNARSAAQRVLAACDEYEQAMPDATASALTHGA